MSGADGAAAPEAALPSSADYWDADEDDSPYAGLVYAARDDDEDTSVAGPRPAPELSDDAPPFATAPFVAMPRLNRVRSTPAPPADEEPSDEDR